MQRNSCKKIIYTFFVLLITFSLSSCSDGKKIEGSFVFSSNRNERFDSFILQNGKIELIKEKSSRPVWSSDGTMIACDKVGDKGDKEDGIYILNSTGKEKEFIPTKFVSGSLVWHGDKIFYTMSSENYDDVTPNALWVYDLVRYDHEIVLKISNNDWISHYAVSADGDRILYRISTPNTFKFKGTYLYDRKNKETIEVEKCIGATWYPDGKHVLCIMYPEKDIHESGTYWGHFTKYNVETGEKEYLARVPFLNLTGLKVSRDGKWAYYAGANSIYMSPIDDLNKRERVTEPVRTRSGLSQDRSPDWYQGE